MLRADTKRPVKFIYSQQAAAAVNGKPDTWLLCEGGNIGRLSLVRFNQDGKAEKPVSLFLINDGWILNRKNNKTIPAVTVKRIHEIPMFAAHVLNIIQKKYPGLNFTNMRQPEAHEQTTQSCYAKYNLQHVTQGLVPITDQQCTVPNYTVAVKAISQPNIYTLPRPSTVFFSKSLAKEPVAVPTEVVEQELGFIWTETNVVRPYHIHELCVRLEGANAIALDDRYYMLLNEQLAENRGKIGITYAGEEMGYVVVAMEDLPSETILTTYTGNVRPRSDVFVDQCLNSRYAMTYDCQSSEMLFALDAVDYRNFGAMISHLPRADTIAKYSFLISELDVDPEDGRPDIATQNVRILKYTYRHFPFAIIETTTAVKKGQVLGFDYEVGYWQALGITPSLFTRRGKPLNPDTYQADNIMVEVRNHATKKRFYVEASVTTFLDKFKANYGYYVFEVAGEQVAISGGEFLLNYKKNPRRLFMDVKDCIDEYNLAYRNTFGLRK